VPLTGHVRELSLPNLIQLHCSEARSARITLVAATQRGALYLADGAVIDADAAGQRGADAVYEMLGWQDARFQVELDTPAWEQTTITLPWNALVLEGLRRHDEWQAARLAEVEIALRTLVGQRGLRAALLVTPQGTPRAASHATIHPAEVDMVMRVGHQFQALRDLLARDNLDCLLVTWQTEKFMCVLYQGDYLGCWLEARANPETIKTLLRALPHATH